MWPRTLRSNPTVKYALAMIVRMYSFAFFSSLYPLFSYWVPVFVQFLVVKFGQIKIQWLCEGGIGVYEIGSETKSLGEWQGYIYVNPLNRSNQSVTEFFLRSSPSLHFYLPNKASANFLWSLIFISRTSVYLLIFAVVGVNK